MRETIPDRVIDEADGVELVDLPPDELLKRLKEGKVYVPDQAARAIREFFRKGNLTALRELAMRRAAERVDDQMRAYMQMRAIPGPWPAGEHMLVCVSPSPQQRAVGPRGAAPGRRAECGVDRPVRRNPGPARLAEASRTASPAPCTWPRSWAAGRSRWRAGPLPRRCSNTPGGTT